jgi:hypothetical protein
MATETHEALLPGEEFVNEGLADLLQARETDYSLLVLIAAPRLRALGLDIPERRSGTPFEPQLYARLYKRLGDGAHSYYNSLIRRVVSYAHALERERSADDSNG